MKNGNLNERNFIDEVREMAGKRHPHATEQEIEVRVEREMKRRCAPPQPTARPSNEKLVSEVELNRARRKAAKKKNSHLR